MPVQPLIDLEQLDLSEVVIPLEEYRQLLHQRGRFELMDGVLHFDLEGGVIVGFKDIRADDWWAEDHIPGRPLFPGCLMIEGAAQLGTYHFLRKRPDLQGAFVGFSAIEHVRFRATVEPPSRLVTVCRLARFRSRMFTYDGQAFVDGKLAFEARVSGTVIETAPVE